MTDYIPKKTRESIRERTDKTKSFHLKKDDYTGNPSICGELIETGQTASYMIGEFHVLFCPFCNRNFDATDYDKVILNDKHGLGI